MRVTIDLDTKDWNVLQKCIRRSEGLELPFPNEIISTRRGYHIIWRDLNISETEALRYREILGDDSKLKSEMT